MDSDTQNGSDMGASPGTRTSRPSQRRRTQEEHRQKGSRRP